MSVVVRRFAGAARRLDPRPSESLPSSPSIRGNAAAAPPAFPSAPAPAWPHEDCANEPAGFFACGERNALWALGARVVLVLVLFAASLSSQGAVREVGAIGLTVGNLDRELEFFTKVLPFEKLSESKSTPRAADELLGLSGTQLRSAELKLSDEACIPGRVRSGKCFGAADRVAVSRQNVVQVCVFAVRTGSRAMNSRRRAESAGISPSRRNRKHSSRGASA